MSHKIDTSFVSIIIPVFNDVERLKICLKALSEQTYPQSNYEIIVIDNGSTADIKNILNQNVKYLHESVPGSHRARNKGIKMAKGTLLAFTDADCIPSQNWIEKGVSALKHADYIAGKITFTYICNQPNNVELFDSITGFQQKTYIEKYHFGAMANVFVKKEVIEVAGYLNGELKSGGDLEWGQRVYKNKFTQKYDSSVVVGHSARNSIKQIIQKHRRIVGGLMDMQKDKSLKKFLIDLKDDWPRLKDVRSLSKKDELSKFKTRVNILFIFLMVKSARIFERIRIRFGGQSKRI